MRTKSLKLALLVFSIMLFSYKEENKIVNGEGYVNVTGGKIWYRVTGQDNNIPVVLVHGGPGSPSYYLNPLMELGKDRQVIMFDQLGCGRSGRITDTGLMSVDACVEQMRTLLNQLGVTEFYLYGHSWGSMLATDYYFKHPGGIKALILASPILSVTAWAADADTLISSLPDSTAAVLKSDLKGLQNDAGKFDAAMSLYIQTFGARKHPLSADFDSTFSQNAQNIMEHLWGTSEFVANGTLKNYNRTNDLHKISIPVLYVIGDNDEVRLNTAKYYQSLTPASNVAVIKMLGI